MTLLLNILRAVYWFDPVVHFAFSELRADMESACDSDVLAYIGHEQKRGYLTVILDMFSYDTEPILGMSQIRSKRMGKAAHEGSLHEESYLSRLQGDNAVHRADNVPMLLHHRLPERAGKGLSSELTNLSA